MSIQTDHADRFLAAYARVVRQHRLFLKLDPWGDLVIAPWSGAPEELCYELDLIRGNTDLPAPDSDPA
jgi:hypothetical protein